MQPLGKLLAAILMSVLICVTPPKARAQESAGDLTQQLTAVLADSALAGVSVAAVVRNAATGEIVYDDNGDKRLPAASAQKLLTSATAMADLGPDFRFRTSVLAAHAPVDGVIEGDLYLRGRGDPTLVVDRLDELANMLATHGIKQVKGNLIADDSWFDDERLGIDWSQQDENFAYAAPISALSVSPDPDFNTGSVQVDMRPGKSVGGPAEVGLTPPTSAIHLENQLQTGPAGSPRQLAAERIHGSDRIVVSGNMPVDGRPAHPLRSVPSPTAYAADVFQSALMNHGVHVNGTTRTGVTPDGAIELAAVESIPLRELLFPFLKLSNNPIAEILVKSMGRRDANAGSWPAGLRVLERYLATHQVDPARVQLMDGSGLSTADLIAPDDLTAFLVALQSEPWFNEWYAALPIAGAPQHLVGGTLTNRMVGTAAALNLHGKTGTLTTTSLLCGYITAQSGQQLVFAVVENGFIGLPPRGIEDAFAVTLAEAVL